MTNKEKFVSLVSSANESTIEGIRHRKENKEWLRESKRIAVNVLFALKELGMTQKNLAEQMGVSPQYINKLVKGKENLTLDTITKLQKILNISILIPAIEEDSINNQIINIIEYQQPYQKEYTEYKSSYKLKISG